jgi:hypothetical protein
VSSQDAETKHGSVDEDGRSELQSQRKAQKIQREFRKTKKGAE